MGVKQSKKRKRENAGASSYSCAPPDSVRACGHKGIFLFYLATTMMLHKSPILIPQRSYGIKLQFVVGKNEAKAGEEKCH